MSVRLPYAITVRGERVDRQALIGCLVDNESGLSRAFFRKNGALILLFRYRGDARIVLRKAEKQLGCERPVPDTIQYQSAKAEITKLS